MSDRDKLIEELEVLRKFLAGEGWDEDADTAHQALTQLKADKEEMEGLRAHLKMEKATLATRDEENESLRAELEEARRLFDSIWLACVKDEHGKVIDLANEAHERIKKVQPQLPSDVINPSFRPKGTVVLTEEELRRCHEEGCEFKDEIMRRIRQMQSQATNPEGVCGVCGGRRQVCSVCTEPGMEDTRGAYDNTCVYCKPCPKCKKETEGE